jgi:hypothetical protein
MLPYRAPARRAPVPLLSFRRTDSLVLVLVISCLVNSSGVDTSTCMHVCMVYAYVYKYVWCMFAWLYAVFGIPDAIPDRLAHVSKIGPFWLRTKSQKTERRAERACAWIGF